MPNGDTSGSVLARDSQRAGPSRFRSYGLFSVSGTRLALTPCPGLVPGGSEAVVLFTAPIAANSSIIPGPQSQR